MRDAQLAHHDHIQRRIQRSGDLESDGNPAAGQAQDDDVGSAQ
jgi:hypothetical protein